VPSAASSIGVIWVVALVCESLWNEKMPRDFLLSVSLDQ